VVRRGSFDSGPVALEATDVHAAPFLRGVSLTAHVGEVVCITGGIGSGRRELARCLIGAQRPERGLIVASGRKIRSPRHAVRARIGFVPDDRKQDGMFLPLDLVENMDLSRLSTRREPFVVPAPRHRRVAKLAAVLQISYRGLSRPVAELSGGNQQKALVGRSLSFDAKVLVLDEPTNGVDVNTKFELYALLRRLAAEGASLIVFSSDFEEIKLLADRVLVMRRGKIVDELTPQEVSESRLLAVERA
jgi:ribose transport system ATP-binding protein